MTPIMTAAYVYDVLGLVESITYGNGMVESYLYDAANRVTEIKYVSGGQTVLQLDYTYTADNLPETITESGSLSGSATVTYTYDKRRRLTQEVRTGASAYNFAYEYDKGGNRTVKTYSDATISRRTDYIYDTSAPSTYQSNNNRLMKYELYNTIGGGNVLDSTTWYYYTEGGNVERIVTNSAGTQQYTATRFGYALNGSTVTYAMGESWNWNGVASCPAGPTGYAISWAREFRYDGARARYLNRLLDTAQLMQGNIVAVAGGDTWTDYDDDEAYGDFTVSGSVATNVRSYQPGMAVVDPWVSTGPSATDYLTTDHLGTTRGMTMPGGAADDQSMASYSAFGEKISGENHRFGYVGAHGYQSHNEMPYLHIGARYYDPVSGRFLQRDPSGIDGGINVYEYAWSSPSAFFDPDGFAPQGGSGGGAALNPKNAKEVVETLKDVEKVLGKGGKKLPKPSPKTPNWSKPPGKGYEWKGKGPQGSKEGSWVHPNGDKWRPDPNHGPPYGPHWDRIDTSGKKWRVFPDGTCKPK